MKNLAIWIQQRNTSVKVLVSEHERFHHKIKTAQRREQRFTEITHHSLLFDALGIL